MSSRLIKLLGLPSRLWLLSACTLLASPLAVATLYFPPPGAFVCLIFYYFFAETWFAVLFTVIVEIVDPEVSWSSLDCGHAEIKFSIDFSGSFHLYCNVPLPDESCWRESASDCIPSARVLW